MGVDRGALDLLQAKVIADLDKQHVSCKAVDMPEEDQCHQDKWLVHMPAAVSEAARRVYEAAFDTIRINNATGNNLPLLVLGGDHSIAIGSISGIFNAISQEECQQKHPDLKMGEPVVIWFDAHADINTLATTKSGNIHGCPVAFLLNHPDTRELPEFEWFFEKQEAYQRRTGNSGFVTPDRLAYIGLRDVEEGEMGILNDLGIMPNAWFMEDIEERGRNVEGVVDAILTAVDPEGCRPIHFSFDVDGMDPSVSPSTGTPVPNGLTLDETIRIVRRIRATGRLISMETVEVNPLLGSAEDAQTTIDNTVQVIKAILLE